MLALDGDKPEVTCPEAQIAVHLDIGILCELGKCPLHELSIFIG